MVCDRIQSTPHIRRSFSRRIREIVATAQQCTERMPSSGRPDFPEMRADLEKLFFLNRRDKVCIVPCRTSNAGATEFQDLNVDDKPLWLTVAERVSSIGDVNGNCALAVWAI